MNAARIFCATAIVVSAIACTPPEAPRPTPTADGSAARLSRTSWGDPSIEGTYTNKDEFGTPFERPDELAGRSRDEFGPEEMAALMAARSERGKALAKTIGGSATNDTGAGPPHWYEYLEAVNSRPWFVSEPADGRVPPLTEHGKQRADAARLAFASSKREAPDTYTDMGLYDRCITLGLPSSMMPMIYGNAYEITQSPGYVAIRYEMVHETRIIPLDSRPHVSKSVGLDMGDARGRWVGNSLVVETTNFRERSAYRNANVSALKIIERFTRTAPDTLEWTVTVDDSTTWVRPWTFSLPLTMNDQEPVLEYACHEGNYAMRNMLSGERAAEREAVAK